MPRSKTNEDLAKMLEAGQVDRTVLDEAARRLRNIDLQHLLTANEIVEAVSATPLIDKDASRAVEAIVSNITLSKKSSSSMSSLAAKILSGQPYEHHHVKSLAASVLAQDEDAGQD